MFYSPFKNIFFILSQSLSKDRQNQEPLTLGKQNMAFSLMPLARLEPTMIRDLMVKSQCTFLLGHRSVSLTLDKLTKEVYSSHKNIIPKMILSF